MIKKENLSDKMKNEAVSLGLCAQWTAEWQDNTSKDDMVEKFVRGIDFCIGRNWPLAKDIKKYFGDVIHNHGVYVDENVNLADLCVDFLHESLYSVLVRDVTHVSVHILDACFLVRGKTFVYELLLYIIEDDVLNSCARKRLRDVETDAV